jgi:hypothetical protein
VTAHFGYMDVPDVPRVLAQLDPSRLECPVDFGDATFFVSTIDLFLGRPDGMARWRKHLFIATSHIAADASDYFQLPRDRTVMVGARIVGSSAARQNASRVSAVTTAAMTMMAMIGRRAAMASPAAASPATRASIVRPVGWPPNVW